MQHQSEQECELSHKSSSSNQNSAGAYVEEEVSKREILFGIEARLGTAPVVASALLKRRYCDFLVNEIDLDGNVLHLTSFDVPQEQEKAQQEADLSLLEKFLSSEKIFILNTGTAVETNEIETKEERTKLHQFIREHFSGKFVSETKDGKKVKIIPKAQSASCTSDRRNNLQASQIIRFLLQKENRDTMECVGFIASILRISLKSISYAGTKDKRGITTQAVTIRGVAPNRLAGLNKSLRNAKIGNFSKVDSMLGLGDLKGNEFVVILRDLQLVEGENSMKQLKDSISHLSSNGFINYFGLQRFGTGCKSTCSIGEALLKGEWKQAVRLIMSSHVASNSVELASLQREWLEDEQKTHYLRKIPSRLLAERSIANFLLSESGSNANNYLGALERIPRELKMLYLHSFQSLIWNKAATERISLNRTSPIVGDLVLVEDEGKKAKAIVIESESELQKYSIFDVVLPLPGFDVIYPIVAEVDNIYQETKGLFQENSSSNNKFGISLSGSYRKLVQLPAALNWSIKRYSNDDLPLVSTLDIKQSENEIGDKQALIISFQLPTSSYATMCLRECISLKA
jgi:tRNA pseudouridine13 synthase